MSFCYKSIEYIVTRVEEEHLWECKQLGAHSPHVLLSTLMFFNTKHFNLTVSTSRIMSCRIMVIIREQKKNNSLIQKYLLFIFVKIQSVENHMQLSFSHIMKHWKRNVPNTKTTGSRNVLLRFYPPQTSKFSLSEMEHGSGDYDNICFLFYLFLKDQNAAKRKVREQQENEENPLRCPVRLYEFYLSKW